MASKTRNTEPAEEKACGASLPIKFDKITPFQVIRCTKSAVPVVSYRYFTSDVYLKSGEVGLVKAARHSYGTAVTLKDGSTKYATDEGEYEQVPADDAKGWHEKYIAKQRDSFSCDKGYNQSLTIGLDPEIFVLDRQGDLIPAFKFLNAKPTSVEYNTVPYWDGFQAEWNTRPTYCHAWVVDYVQQGLKSVIEQARLHYDSPRLAPASVVKVPLDLLRKSKPEHVEFGCAPSKNAYGDSEGFAISNGRDIPLRFAGFHIHFGYKKIYPQLKPDDYCRLVKGIDRILGPIMTSMLAGIEDTRRRAFYGRAGEYRLPAHGLEYRVPSSTVMCNPLTTHIVLDMARYASHIAMNNLEKVWEIPGGDDQVRDVIDHYDIKEARKILKLNGTILQKMLANCYGSDTTAAKGALAIIMEGAANVINTTAMHENWKINGTWATHSDGANECMVRSTEAIFKFKE